MARRSHEPNHTSKNFCTPCQKVGFSTEGKAMLAAMRARCHGAPKMRTYHSRKCSLWHLTSKPHKFYDDPSKMEGPQE